MNEVEMKWAVRHVNEINLIDVRSPGEYKSGHIEGAENIPMMGLIMNASSFLNKDETYYIHCLGGVRSSNVIRELEGQGYNLINCRGGLEAL